MSPPPHEHQNPWLPFSSRRALARLSQKKEPDQIQF